ncbi:MAG TPA: SCO family protein [Acidobacteriaceae bacterium]|nr:SCO family protein [Acidobacteriaceae bacterium]
MLLISRFGVAALVVGAAMMLLPSGCRKESNNPAGVELHPAAVTEKQYRLQGMVLATSTATSEITIRHGDIPGFMPAMTMVYKVKNPVDVQKLKPGDEITADVLVPSDSDNYLLDRVVITSEKGRKLPPTMLPPHALMVGETVPDVPLVNQDGKLIHLQDYRGKAVLITFIYTRCPMPTACPLITSHFAKVNDLLAKMPAAYAASHLISVSLDPNYDQPPVLRQYGMAYLDDNASAFAHWEFADTTPGDLKKLAQAFGLQYTEEDNQITHTMQTTLLDKDNKVAQQWGGSGWSPSEVANAVAALALQAGR